LAHSQGGAAAGGGEGGWRGGWRAVEGGQTFVQITLVGLRAGDKGRGGVSSLLQESTNEWVEGGWRGGRSGGWEGEEVCDVTPAFLIRNVPLPVNDDGEAGELRGRGRGGWRGRWRGVGGGSGRCGNTHQLVDGDCSARTHRDQGSYDSAQLEAGQTCGEVRNAENLL
jgi:hypothetical protein